MIEDVEQKYEFFHEDEIYCLLERNPDYAKQRDSNGDFPMNLVVSAFDTSLHTQRYSMNINGLMEWIILFTQYVLDLSIQIKK